MTATTLLTDELRGRGIRADWVATSQTGLLLRGEGRVIDSIPIDFVPGVIERLVLAAEQTSDVVVVEGQGFALPPLVLAVDVRAVRHDTTAVHRVVSPSR